MKKAICTLLLIFAAFYSFSQSMPPVDGVPLVTAQDYRTAENVVVQVDGNLLSTPIDKANETRLYAGLFLMKWINGTPDFDFTTEQKPLKYLKKDADLITVYCAALTSFTLQYRSVKDHKALTVNAVKAFLDYVNNANNHVVLTKNLKKLSDANQQGTLEKFLNL